MEKSGILSGENCCSISSLLPNSSSACALSLTSGRLEESVGEVKISSDELKRSEFLEEFSHLLYLQTYFLA